MILLRADFSHFYVYYLYVYIHVSRHKRWWGVKQRYINVTKYKANGFLWLRILSLHMVGCNINYLRSTRSINHDQLYSVFVVGVRKFHQGVLCCAFVFAINVLWVHCLWSIHFIDLTLYSYQTVWLIQLLARDLKACSSPFYWAPFIGTVQWLTFR